MPFITNKDVELYYQDYGTGQPVILIHGWPLSHRAWEGQVNEIVENGFRCISYDRRGFGVSSAPYDGYDYTTLASDLHAIVKTLELTNIILVGFSMGGGEVVRYLTEYGTESVAKVALLSAIIPLVKRHEDNPAGVPESNLHEIMKALDLNRVGFLKEFHKNFYNYADNNPRISKAQLDYDFSIASFASPRGTIETAKAWAETDFRSELVNITVPTLIVHGDADNIVPKETSADQAAKGIEHNQYEILEDAPHGILVTHRVEVNKILLQFLKAS